MRVRMAFLICWFLVTAFMFGYVHGRNVGTDRCQAWWHDGYKANGMSVIKFPTKDICNGFEGDNKCAVCSPDGYHWSRCQQPIGLKQEFPKGGWDMAGVDPGCYYGTSPCSKGIKVFPKGGYEANCYPVGDCMPKAPKPKKHKVHKAKRYLYAGVAYDPTGDVMSERNTPIWSPLPGEPGCEFWDEATQKINGHYGTALHTRCTGTKPLCEPHGECVQP